MIISKDEFTNRQSKFFKELAAGAVFIYPTDTVYGIGCDAANTAAVQRIREIKDRAVMPFSVIAPSIKWIRDHCIVKDETWLSKLPGPYTLIFPAKDFECISHDVAMGRGSLGVRIPDHWISEVIAAYGKPIVTTSANVTGGNVMQAIEDLPAQLRHVDFIIYEGPRHGNASTLIDLTEPKPKIIAR